MNPVPVSNVCGFSYVKLMLFFLLTRKEPYNIIYRYGKIRNVLPKPRQNIIIEQIHGKI